VISKKHRISKVFFKNPPLGRVIHGRFVTLRIYPTTGDWKAAVVVSKKVQPSAVCRNRIKRQMYEMVRRFMKHPHPLSIVIYPKKGLDRGTVAEIEHDVVSSLKAATLF
jgi:ribonuclease P protein component